MADPPTVPAASLPWLTTAQMREVDRIMVDELGIDLVRMMENAGRELARLVTLRHPEVLPAADPAPRRAVTVYVGGGGNGGGGLTAARRLHAWGVAVSVVLGTERLGPVPASQLTIVRRLGIPVVEPARRPGQGRGEPRRRASVQDPVAVDALVGYGLARAPQGRVGELVGELADRADVVALDAPTGLDTTTGQVPGVAVRAAATVTLAAPKLGLLDPASTNSASTGSASTNPASTGWRPHRLVGDLYLADIAVPPAVYPALGLPTWPGFGGSTLLRVHFDERASAT